MYQTTCGPLNFLNDAQECGIALDQSGYAFNSREECEQVVASPPAPGNFRCSQRAIQIFTQDQ